MTHHYRLVSIGEDMPTCLFANWLNYFVYQVTPYNVKEIPAHGTYADF